jgi:multiple sugar transport system substrate-binding protein
VIVPLDKLAETFGLSEADFFAPVWRGGSYRGQRYGIPLDVHPLGMYFNARAFADAGIVAPPATADEFEDALARLKAGGFSHPFWIPTAWPAHLMFESLLWQNGGSPFSEDGTRVTFASDAGVRALEWMQGIARRGYSPSAVGIDAQWNAFVNGTNAIAWDGIWMLQNAGDVPGGAAAAPLPRIGGQRAVWANAHHLVIFGRPKLDAARVQAAMVFIHWLSHHSLEWARAGQIPARNSVRETPGFRALEGQAAFARELSDIRIVPTGAGIGELQDDAVVFAVDAPLRSAKPGAQLAAAQDLANDQLHGLRVPSER